MSVLTAAWHRSDWVTLALASHSLEKEIPPLPGTGMATLCTHAEVESKLDPSVCFGAAAAPSWGANPCFIHPSSDPTHPSHFPPPSLEDALSSRPPRASYLTVTTWCCTGRRCPGDHCFQGVSEASCWETGTRSPLERWEHSTGLSPWPGSEGRP